MEVYCPKCGSTHLGDEEARYADCPTCGGFVYWPPCEKCGKTQWVDASASSWKCASCGRRNNHLSVSATFLSPKVTYYGDRPVPQNSISFMSAGVKIGNVGAGLLSWKPLFIPYWHISDIAVDGPQEFQRRITFTRLAALGLFAVAFPKADRAMAFVTLTVTDGQEHVTQIPQHPMQVRGKLQKAFSAWEKLRPATTTRDDEGGAEEAAASTANRIAADPLDQINKLGELRDVGLLTEEEFERKKRELLDRL